EGDMTPELRRLQYVGTVVAAQLARALGCRREGAVSNATDFRFRIVHGVVTLALPLEGTVSQLLHTAGLTEIYIPGQLSDDPDIEAGDDLRLQRRCIRQLRIQNRGSEVGKQAQSLAQAQDGLLGP